MRLSQAKGASRDRFAATRATGQPRPARAGHRAGRAPRVRRGRVILTVAVQLPAAGDVGPWAALLLVVVGSVLGYRRARAKGHRDLGIGLLIGIAAGLVTGFGALIAFTAAVLSNFT